MALLGTALGTPRELGRRGVGATRARPSAIARLRALCRPSVFAPSAFACSPCRARRLRPLCARPHLSAPVAPARALALVAMPSVLVGRSVLVASSAPSPPLGGLNAPSPPLLPSSPSALPPSRLRNRAWRGGGQRAWRGCPRSRAPGARREAARLARASAQPCPREEGGGSARGEGIRAAVPKGEEGGGAMRGFCARPALVVRSLSARARAPTCTLITHPEHLARFDVSCSLGRWSSVP